MTFVGLCLHFGCSNLEQGKNSLGPDESFTTEASLRSILVNAGYEDEKLAEHDNAFIYDGDIVIRKTDIEANYANNQPPNVVLQKTLQKRFQIILTTDNNSIMKSYTSPSITGPSLWDWGVVQILFPMELSTLNEMIFGVGTDYKIWIRRNVEDRWIPFWANRVGDVTDLNIMSNGIFIGVGKDKKRYTRTTINSNWVRASNISGDVIGVAIALDGTIIGVGTDKKLWTRATLNSNWVMVNNRIGDIIDVHCGLGR